MNKKLFQNVPICRRSNQKTLSSVDLSDIPFPTWTLETPFGTIGQIQLGSCVFGFPLNPKDPNDPFYRTEEFYSSIPYEAKVEARDYC